MRSRVLAPVLIASLVAIALPVSSQASGRDRGRVERFSGGGRMGPVQRPSYVYRGTPVGRPGTPPVRGPHRAPFDYGLPFEWHGGPVGWGALYFGGPFWWDAYWSWGWPYPYWDGAWAWGWPYGYYGYGGYYWPYTFDYDGYPYSIFRVPSNAVESEMGTTGEAAEVPEEPAETVPGVSAVELQISPPTAFVLLNDVLIGSADEFGAASDYLYLDSGEYTLEFRAPDFRTKTLHLTVGGGDKTVVSVGLEVDPSAPAGGPAPPSPGLPHGRRFSPSFGSPTGPPTSSPAPADGPAN